MPRKLMPTIHQTVQFYSQFDNSYKHSIGETKMNQCQCYFFSTSDEMCNGLIVAVNLTLKLTLLLTVV